jgi:hypothetical protein
MMLMLVSAQVLLAIYFTNSKWDVQQDQEFLLQWAYDGNDPTNSTWAVTVWLSEGNGR